MSWTTGPFGEWGRWHEAYIERWRQRRERYFARWRFWCFVRVVVLSWTMAVVGALLLVSWVGDWNLLTWRVVLFSMPLRPRVLLDVPEAVVWLLPVVLAAQVLWLLDSHYRWLLCFGVPMFFMPLPGTLAAYAVLVWLGFQTGWLPRPAAEGGEFQE